MEWNHGTRYIKHHLSLSHMCQDQKSRSPLVVTSIEKLWWHKRDDISTPKKRYKKGYCTVYYVWCLSCLSCLEVVFWGYYRGSSYLYSMMCHQTTFESLGLVERVASSGSALPYGKSHTHMHLGMTWMPGVPVICQDMHETNRNHPCMSSFGRRPYKTSSEMTGRSAQKWIQTLFGDSSGWNHVVYVLFMFFVSVSMYPMRRRHVIVFSGPLQLYSYAPKKQKLCWY